MYSLHLFLSILYNLLLYHWYLLFSLLLGLLFNSSIIFLHLTSDNYLLPIWFKSFFTATLKFIIFTSSSSYWGMMCCVSFKPLRIPAQDVGHYIFLAFAVHNVESVFLYGEDPSGDSRIPQLALIYKSEGFIVGYYCQVPA